MQFFCNGREDRTSTVARDEQRKYEGAIYLEAEVISDNVGF